MKPPYWSDSNSPVTYLQTLKRFELTQVLLQEQQIDAEVVVEGRDHTQSTKSWQHLVRPEEAGALTCWSQSSVSHQRSQKHIHHQVEVAEKPEDAHCDELALDGRRHHAVVLQHSCSQVAGELVGEGGQLDVEAEVEAGQQEDQQGQAPARQVLHHEAVREALGLQILLH